jgi:uncharacterized membrane protein required for colicin V production
MAGESVPIGDKRMNSIGNNLPVNWFDVLVLVLLVVGALRGRKRGMSQELIPLLKWVTVVVVCGLFYRPVAQFFTQAMSTVSMLTASIAAYLTLGMVVAIIFAVLSRQLGGKIVGSDLFGKAEYYLGIVSGIVRFACMLIFGMALLNAREFTQKEIDDRNLFVRQNYDSDFFPALYQIQNQVFRESFSGPVIYRGVGQLLINPTVSESKPLKRKELDLPI